jgi:hypothetical protein
MTMSDHIWVQENVVAFLADALDPAERERFHGHVGECAECARALDALRGIDERLEAAFAADRPQPGLEDRLIQALRKAPRPGIVFRLSRRVKLGLAAAAVLILAGVGAGVTSMIERDRLGFPRASSAKNLRQMQLLDSTDSMSVNDPQARPKATAWLESEGLQNADGHTRYLEGQDGGKRRLRGRIDPKDLHNLTVRNVDDLAGEGREKNSPSTPMPDSQIAVNGRTHDGTSLASDWDGEPSTKKPAFSPDGRKLASTGEYKKVDDKGRRADSSRDYFKPADVLSLQYPDEPSVHFPRLPEKKEQSKRELEDARQNQEKAEKDVEKKPRVAPVGDLALPVQDQPGPDKKPEPAPQFTRKIIRSGDMEFEIDSFDAAVASINRLVAATKGGYVDTVNSKQLDNGKVKGSVVIRVPPDQLDKLVLGLRKELGKMGELKSQRIGSQDITKRYTDMESQLRAARTMEERFLRIIKDGKGAIKDLVMAEKELGVYRTKIEELEGELRYYANLVALSTLTVNLVEKEIRAAARLVESKRIQASIEVDDVDQAKNDAVEVVIEAKGRVTRSDTKRKGGQHNAILEFEVPPEADGVVRDRLRRLGNVVRLDIDAVQTTEGGATAPRDGKVKRGDTKFILSLYNLANVEPRETVTMTVAAADVNAAFQALRGAIAKNKGHFIDGQLDEKDRQNITAKLVFDVRRADEAALLTALTGAGDVLSRQSSRVKENENLTDAKVLFKVDLVPAANIAPREIAQLGLLAANVEATLALLTSQAKEAGAQVIGGPKTLQEPDGRISARIIYAVPFSAYPALVEKFKSTTQVRLHRLIPNPQAPEGKLSLAQIDVTLSNEVLVPRDEGLWSQVRNGLSFSLRGLSISAGWLIVGLLFVLPWLLLIVAVIWFFRRLWRGRPGATPTSPGTSAPAG